MKPIAGKAPIIVGYWVLWLLALYIVFRSFLLSGGDRIVGDLADGQLIQSIHEHWFLVFSGQEEWRNLNIFYPISDTLGYSDTFFIQGIPYSIMRFLGVDMFISFELVQVLLASIGFWGMLIWLRKCRGINPALSGWGAFIFVAASPFFLGIRNSHIQLLAIWLLPVTLVFFEASLKSLQTPGKRLFLNFLFFCVLYGGLVYSTFYAAFFLFLGLFIAFLSAIFLYGPRSVFKTIWPGRDGWKSLLPGCVVLLFWLSLFLWTYLPVRQDMGNRSISYVLAHMPSLWDFFNHSKSNLLWGGLGNLMWDYPESRRWYFELCLPIITFFFTLVASIHVFKQRKKWKESRPELILCACVILVSWLFMIRIGPASPWIIPYYILPGADVIRVVTRYHLALLVPAIYLVCFFLEFIWLQKSVMSRFMVIVFVILIGLEQIQLVENSNISRTEREAILSLSIDPPTDADAFYAIGKPLWGWNTFIPHSSAMYLSKAWGIPTLNGRSGFLAKNWNLYEMDPISAYPEILDWAERQGIQGKIYMYDLDSGEWPRGFDFSLTAESFSTGMDFMSLPEKEFSKLATSGWSDQEFWGVWSNKPLAIIQFPGMQLSSKHQDLVLKLIGFVNDQYPENEVAIMLNGKEVARPKFTREHPKLNLRIPIHLENNQSWRLEFKVVPAASQVSFQLGVGLISLLIEE